MKTLKEILIVTLAIFCTGSFCKGQTITAEQKAEMQRRILKAHLYCIKTAQYIFEGKVIQQKSYYGKFFTSKTEIYTCSIVQITKIFKGSPQLKLGTIKIITYQGGQVEKNGPMSMVSDGWGIGKRGRYILFGMLTTSDGLPLDSNTFNSMVTDNTLILNLMDGITIPGGMIFDTASPTKVRQVAASWGETIYETVDDVYSFFKENGLMVQEEQK